MGGGQNRIDPITLLNSSKDGLVCVRFAHSCVHFHPDSGSSSGVCSSIQCGHSVETETKPEGVHCCKRQQPEERQRDHDLTHFSLCSLHTQHDRIPRL